MSYFIDSKARYNLISYIKECSSYTHILVTFVKRNIKIKYANTLIGILWALFQPIVYIALLVIVFNKVAGLETMGVSAVAFASVGLIPWIFFSQCISNTTALSLSSQKIISKIYFPRIFLPLSSMGESLIDLIVIIIISLIVGAWKLSFSLVYLPLVLVSFILFTFAITTLVSMWTIRFPDIRFLVPVILRIFIFLTPIAYTSNLFQGKLEYLLYLNPLVGYIEAFRYCIMGLSPNMTFIYSSFILSVILLVFSLFYFMRFERKIGDII